MNPGPRRAATVLAAAIFFFGAPAEAQTTSAPAFDLERLILNPSGREGLLVGGGDVLEATGVRLGVLSHYEHAPLVAFDSQNKGLATIVGNRVSAHVSAAFGVNRWLEIGVQLPFVLWQGGGDDAGRVGLSAPRATSMGSPWVQARSGLFLERDGMPFDLSVDLLMNVPVGGPGAFTSDATPSFFPRLGLGRTLGGVARVAVEIGGWFRTSPSFSSLSMATSSLSPTVQLSAGVSTLDPKSRFELSLRSTIPTDGSGAALEAMAGARVPVGPFELQLLAGPGFGRLPGTPLFRVLAGVSFATPASKCVEGRPYALQDCPQLDFDGDGVANGQDLCGRQHGTSSGCPDGDGDGDGVADARDACPGAAGEQARNGCPRLDSDDDGVFDEDDACPAVAGSERGCPPKPQPVRERCVDQPDVFVDQGCPPALVKLESDRLVISEKIFFDPRKATIQARSFALLDEVAKLLRAHPEVEHVFIDGHTDSQGTPEINRTLSRGRADAVKQYLVKAGVEARRLEGRGFGPDRPIADNGTPAGREQNRRVEFVISSQETR